MAVHPITRGRPGERTPGTGTLTGAEITRGLTDGDGRCPAAAYHRWGKLVRSTVRRSLGGARETEGVTPRVFLADWRGGHGRRPERGAPAGRLVGSSSRRNTDVRPARTPGRRNRNSPDVGQSTAGPAPDQSRTDRPTWRTTP
ncbi:hypothetical protein [Streptomyces fagopyri]|uniref:hypothetical protein n=1 Tax=Streptomyces fagopyri TaxID=2662397 RepID=UPI00382DB083